MNEPVEMTVERSAAQSAQALLLARIVATVLGIVLLFAGLVAYSFASKSAVMFAELGVDAELPVLSAMAIRHGGALLIGILILAAATTFFIWTKGRVAAWMAGMGLLLMAVFVPIMVFAVFLPLVKIISEMGSM